MIVVDTSVLIAFFAGRTGNGVDRLIAIETANIPFAIPTLCCQELLQGARDKKEWELLANYLSTQRLLEPQSTFQLHRDAAKIYFDCRRRGLTVRNTVDCLIAQIVLEENGTLLHDDRDFDQIKKVRPLKTLT